MVTARQLLERGQGDGLAPRLGAQASDAGVDPAVDQGRLDQRIDIRGQGLGGVLGCQHRTGQVVVQSVEDVLVDLGRPGRCGLGQHRPPGCKRRSDLGRGVDVVHAHLGCPALGVGPLGVEDLREGEGVHLVDLEAPSGHGRGDGLGPMLEDGQVVQAEVGHHLGQHR